MRGLLGFFYQKQEHDFYQEFGLLPGLADHHAAERHGARIPDFPGVVYLNSMDREDTDKAVFGTIAFDITDTLELSLGGALFRARGDGQGILRLRTRLHRSPRPATRTGRLEPGDPANGGDGAFEPNGVGLTAGSGEWRCPSQVETARKSPCQNVDKGISESDSVYRVNLTWKATDTAMLYATWSEGYRPGGISRNPFVPAITSADILTNYELGWKTRFADDRFQFNGAIFLEEWDDIQVSFQGDNGITQVANGPKAEVKGIEVQLDWLPTDSLRLGVVARLLRQRAEGRLLRYDSDVDGDGTSPNA